MADFVGKQFSKDEVAEKVKEQYDEEHTVIFYQCVMGGGGHDIHFGLFREAGDGVGEAGNNTTEFMMSMLDWGIPVKPGCKVLDLGSGHGGGTHALVQKFGCSVHGYNLGPRQNEFNLEQCKKLSIADKVTCEVGDLNDSFPAAWAGSFDAVWSCEVLCHAADKVECLKEVYKCLKPGGVLVFSDIMGADGADEKALKDFTDRNATSYMGRPSSYIEAIHASGLKYMCWYDQSHHLRAYFQGMLDQCHNHRETMMSKGLTGQYIDNWVQSLTDRVQIQTEKKVFAWGVFVARKPE